MTLTKEWLQHQTAEFESCAERTDGYRLDEGGKNTLAALKMALAVMEAEHKDKAPELSQVIYHFRDWNEGFPVERFKADYVISWMLANYPPAPQPLTTSERAELENYRNAQQVVPDVEPYMHGLWPNAVDALMRYANACRAAMLQGAEPVQEWIPCSERMPDKLIPVMVMYEDGEMWSAMWNGNRWDDGTEYPDPHSVTHWRKMPAAPQQEDE